MSVRTRANQKTTKNSVIYPNGTGAITAALDNGLREDEYDSMLFSEDLFVFTATGTDTYAVTVTPAAAAANQRLLLVKFTNANTGAATLNVNSIGAVAIKKNVSSALVAGDISAGSVHVLAYDGTNLQIVGSLSSAVATLAAGTWTPTLTGISNVTGSTAYLCMYNRVGNTVTVSGRFDVDPTSTGASQLDISIPIASNFTDPYQAGGTANCITTADAGGIASEATNNRLTFSWNATVTSNQIFYFVAMYQVI